MSLIVDEFWYMYLTCNESDRICFIVIQKKKSQKKKVILMLNRKGILPSLLKESDALSYSFPINIKYHRSVSFSSSHVGMMLAYSSSNLIIILVEGKYVKAILRGHEYDISTLCFEVKGPHLISGDIKGNVIFWYYQDSVWQITRKLVLKPAATSFSWCAARATVCYSSSDGLFLGNIDTFDTEPTRIAKTSKFCQFFHDGSILASHSYRHSLLVFSININNVYVPQAFQFASDICVFEFHPIEAMFMVITVDGQLRLFTRDHKSNIFSCTTMLSVPIPGRFVRPPALYKFKHRFNKEYTIVFISSEGVKIKLKIDDKGNILTPKPQNLFKSLPPQLNIKEHGLRAAFKTNKGVEVVTVKYNGISVHSNTKYTTLFHRAKVTHSSFAPTSDNFFTLDEDKMLMFWPFLNPYESPRIISRKAESAAWFGNRHLLVLQDNHLVSCDVLTGAEYEFSFPKLENCKSLFVNDKDVYAICNDKIITKNRDYPIGNYVLYSFSAVYKNYFLFIKSTNDNQVVAHIFPSFDEIPVAKRREHHHIDALSCLSLNSFAVLSNPSIEIWNFVNDGFELTYKFDFSPMNGLICDSWSYGGRIFTYDDRRIYLIDNGIIPFLDQKDVTTVATSSNGHFVAISRSSMHLFPLWTSKLLELEKTKIPGEFINRKDVYLNVDRMTADSRFLLNLSEIVTHNFLPSPAAVIKPNDELKKTINLTLCHLLEYSMLDKLDEITPMQIPAIPAQYASSVAINDCTTDNDEILRLNSITKSIKEDVDMFGLRYLTAVKSSYWPPAYVGLWLSYSISQSQICMCLEETITTNNLTKFFLAIGIHNQNLLENLVKQALARTWAQSKKIDPVAVFYIAMSNRNKVSKLYELVGDTQRSDFFKKDFTNEKNKRSALKNAYSSLSRQNFMMASALFLIAGDSKSAIQMISDKLNDPILAFLIIRLIDKTCTSDLMKWFLANVKWGDAVIPIIIANLLRKNNIAEMIEPLLLDNRSSQNATSMGDRRIALYQIYHRLTNNSSFVTTIARNMLNDGLAQLANYLLKFPRQQLMVQASISSNIVLSSDDDKEHEESNNNFFATEMNNTDTNSSEQSDDDFDFGGNVMDDWDDDYSSDSESESEDKNNNKETIEMNNSQEILQSEQQISNAMENNKEEGDIKVVRNFLTEQIEAFSRFHSKHKKGNINNDDIASYALHFGFSDIAFDLFSEVWKNLFRKNLSKFIDYCGAMYIESAQIPASNKRLLELCGDLAHKLSDQPFSYDYNSIMALPNTGFSHSVLFGSFVAAAWSFEPHFVDQILNQNKIPKEFLPESLPHSCSMFDSDIGSPRFPDTIPQLVIAFSRSDVFHSTNIESARFIVMFLIFRRIVTLSKEFKPEGRWHRLLNEKYKQLLQTLEMYQIAQSAPSVIAPQWSGRETNKIPLIDLVKEEYETAKQFFHESHVNAFHNLPFQSLFRNGKFCLSQPFLQSTPFDRITACSLNPQNNAQCAFASGSQVAVMNLLNPSEVKMYNTSSFMSAEIFQIVSHPTMHLFLTVSSAKVKLFDFDAQNKEQSFNLPPEKIIAASFSSTGERLAIATDQTLSIFLIDLSQEVLMPYFTSSLGNKPTDIAWVGSEDTIAVSFQQNIKVIDTITMESQTIPMNKEWGSITSMKFNESIEYLVAGTKKGFTIIFDARSYFDIVCVITCNFPVVSLSYHSDVFVAATEKGQVSMFSSMKLDSLDSHRLQWDIRCVAVSSDFIIAAGDSKYISIWKAE